MPTTVHLPRTLLAALDRRARALRTSRNRLIVGLLQSGLASESEWSPGFFDRLGPLDAPQRAIVDDMLEAILAARRSRKPRRL